jgi:hypothetical protein
LDISVMDNHRIFRFGLRGSLVHLIVNHLRHEWITFRTCESVGVLRRRPCVLDGSLLTRTVFVFMNTQDARSCEMSELESRSGLQTAVKQQNKHQRHEAENRSCRCDMTICNWFCVSNYLVYEGYLLNFG